MSLADRLARQSDRLFDRLRHRQAHAVREADAVHGDLTPVRGQKYALLVTFRRNGEPVPSPVWVGVDDAGRAYVKTRRDVGKVRRLQNDPRALLAPCTSRGKPTGPAVRVAGRVLDRSEWPHAEATLAAAYGAGRAISERTIGGPEDEAAYLELTPR